MHQKLYEAAKIKAAQDAEDAIQARKVKPGVTGMNRESIHFLIQERLMRRAQEEGESLAQEDWRQNQAGPSQSPVAAQGMEQPSAPAGAAPSAAHAPNLQTAPAQAATVLPQEAPAAGASIPGKGMAFKRPFSLFGDDENAIENAAREDAWRIFQAEMEAEAADDTPPGYNKILWKASKEMAEKKRKEKRAATDEWLKTYFEQRQAEEQAQAQKNPAAPLNAPLNSSDENAQGITQNDGIPAQPGTLPEGGRILASAGGSDIGFSSGAVQRPGIGARNADANGGMAFLLGRLATALQDGSGLRDGTKPLINNFVRQLEDHYIQNQPKQGQTQASADPVRATAASIPPTGTLRTVTEGTASSPSASKPDEKSIWEILSDHFIPPAAAEGIAGDDDDQETSLWHIYGDSDQADTLQENQPTAPAAATSGTPRQPDVIAGTYTGPANKTEKIQIAADTFDTKAFLDASIEHTSPEEKEFFQPMFDELTELDEDYADYWDYFERKQNILIRYMSEYNGTDAGKKAIEAYDDLKKWFDDPRKKGRDLSARMNWLLDGRTLIQEMQKNIDFYPQEIQDCIKRYTSKKMDCLFRPSRPTGLRMIKAVLGHNSLNFIQK